MYIYTHRVSISVCNMKNHCGYITYIYIYIYIIYLYEKITMMIFLYCTLNLFDVLVIDLTSIKTRITGVIYTKPVCLLIH